MEQVIFQPNKKRSEVYNGTTVTGNGGYVKTGAKEFSKYVNKGGTIASGIKDGVSAAPDPNGVVAARDYAASKGYSGVIDWDGSDVIIGGTAIRPQYIENGIAYVKKYDADRAIADMESASGIKGNANIVAATENRYGRQADDALRALSERAAFRYDPDTDPVYQAYKNQYEREADRAFRKVLNDNNTSVTGASGAVLAEAMANRNNYLSRLTDMIPELADKAYTRYSGETDRLSNTAKLLSGLADEYYNRLYDADSDARDRITAAGAAERKQRQYIDESDREAAQTAAENERNRINDTYKNALNALNIEKGNTELEYYRDMLAADLLNTQLSNADRAIDNAVSRGFFTEGDEAALPWLSDYRTESGYSINPQLAMAA